jgi:hypothetical protein
MIIKSVCKGPWGDRPHTHSTWYEPFDDMDNIQSCVNFALSQKVTGLCTAGDLEILPLFLQACQHFVPLSAEEQEALVASSDQYEPLFPPEEVQA